MTTGLMHVKKSNNFARLEIKQQAGQIRAAITALKASSS